MRANYKNYLLQLLQSSRQLFELKPSTRPWHFSLVAALCVGIPVLIGSYFKHPQYGILSGIGAMVFLYMPQAGIAKRMIRLAWSAIGFLISFALGASCSFDPFMSAFMLTIITLLATIICRFYLIPPPGSFFFILFAAIAVTLPFNLALIPLQIGLIAIGAAFASLMAFIYSFLILRHTALLDLPIPPSRRTGEIIHEALVMGIFVGGSYFLTKYLNFDNPYWVPISCAAIMQGSTFTAVWHRKVHRIFGTIIGMGLTWIIFSYAPNTMEIGLIIIALIFIIEALIVCNYALAVIFITPLTVLFAESTSMGISPNLLVMARLTDIVVGSAIGLIGGWVLHHPGFIRAWREF